MINIQENKKPENILYQQINEDLKKLKIDGEKWQLEPNMSKDLELALTDYTDKKMAVIVNLEHRGFFEMIIGFDNYSVDEFFNLELPHIKFSRQKGVPNSELNNPLEAIHIQIFDDKKKPERQKVKSDFYFGLGKRPLKRKYVNIDKEIFGFDENKQEWLPLIYIEKNGEIIFLSLTTDVSLPLSSLYVDKPIAEKNILNVKQINENLKKLKIGGKKWQLEPNMSKDLEIALTNSEGKNMMFIVNLNPRGLIQILTKCDFAEDDLFKMGGMGFVGLNREPELGRLENHVEKIQISMDFSLDEKLDEEFARTLALEDGRPFDKQSYEKSEEKKNEDRKKYNRYHKKVEHQYVKIDNNIFGFHEKQQEWLPLYWEISYFTKNSLPLTNTIKVETKHVQIDNGVYGNQQELLRQRPDISSVKQNSLPLSQLNVHKASDKWRRFLVCVFFIICLLIIFVKHKKKEKKQSNI